MSKHLKSLALALAALAVSVGLAACGGGGDDESVSGAFEALPDAPAAYADLGGEAELTRSDGGTEARISLEGLQPETAYMAHLHAAGCDAADPGGPHFKFDPEGGDEPPNEIHLMFTSDAEGNGEATAAADQEVPDGEAGSIVVHLGDQEKMAALFVHEGEGHEGTEHEGTDDEGHSHEAPDKVACAELEGGSPEAAAGGSASVPTVVVRNGEPVGGIEELEFDAGEEIRFKVEGDEAEEIHVHGYDLMEDIPAGGGAVEFDFPAEIEGIFEVELEGQGVQIVELRVNP